MTDGFMMSVAVAGILRPGGQLYVGNNQAIIRYRRFSQGSGVEFRRNILLSPHTIATVDTDDTGVLYYACPRLFPENLRAL